MATNYHHGVTVTETTDLSTMITDIDSAVIGVVCALALRRRDIPPAKRYAWEGEEEVPDTDDDTAFDEAPVEHRPAGLNDGAAVNPPIIVMDPPDKLQ